MYVWAPLTHLLSSSPNRTPLHQLKRTITTPLLTLLPHLTTPGTRVLSQGASAVAGSQGAQCVAQVQDDHGEETEHVDLGPLRRLPASVRRVSSGCRRRRHKTATRHSATAKATPTVSPSTCYTRRRRRRRRHPHHHRRHRTPRTYTHAGTCHIAARSSLKRAPTSNTSDSSFATCTNSRATRWPPTATLTGTGTATRDRGPARARQARRTTRRPVTRAAREYPVRPRARRGATRMRGRARR